MVGSGGTLLPHHDIADGVPDAPEPLADLGRTSRVITRGRAVTPTIDWREERRGTLPGNRYVRVLRSQERAFTEVTPSHLVAGASVDAPRTGTGRLVTGIKRALIGRPIASEHAIHERLTKVKALAVLSSDALSSVAYATEQTLIILVLAGAAALRYTLPISIAIVTLLAIVAISYRQTIYAYPNGGGSYIVAKDNLGTLPGLIAAASLLIDYVLTVSVSVSAGVLAIISAFPSAAAYTVPIGVLFILLIMLGNLRGVRESGTIFAIPTYIFVIGILTMIAVGLGRVLMGDPAATSTPRDALHATEGIGLFLVLRAFTSGCTALTGVEA
ncbi:MAG TPA: APC family permease, partial [Thermomicrobiales bacterium]